MNHSSVAVIRRRAILGCCLCILANPGLRASANEPGNQAETHTDALIPMVVLALDTLPPAVSLGDKGFTWNGVVLASQQARPADAVVIDEITNNKMNVKRPLFLVQLMTAGASAQKVWCKDAVNPNATIDCYEDSDGDGMLDRRARGYLPRLEALSMNRLGSFEPIKPIAYRQAEPAELPLFNIDYLLCSAVDSQIKFARRFKKVGVFASSAVGPCDNVASPATGQAGTESEFLLDQTKIKVHVLDGVRTAQMAEGMTPGVLIGPLRTDRPITDIAHATPFSAEHDEARVELPDVYISAPPTIAKEPSKIGTTLFVAEVKHSLTGTLRAAIFQPKIFKGNPTELIPAGARLFGIQMRSTTQSANLDADILWCYPAPLNSATTGAKCIANDGSSVSRVLDVRDRFNVNSVGIGLSDPAIETPLIERGTVDFGEPIVLEIALEKIARKRFALRYSLDRRSERNKSSRHIEIQRGTDGKGYMTVGGGVLILESIGEETIQISEKLPVTVGGDADVDDLIALQRSSRLAH